MRLSVRKAVAFCLLGLAVAVVLSVFYYARLGRRTADDVLRDVQRFRVGNTSFQQVELFRKRYSSYVSYVENKPRTCNPEACWFSVEFKNPLASLILRKSSFGAGIAFSKGSLQEVDLAASCADADRKPPYVPTFVVMVTQSVSNPQFRGGVASSGNGFVFDLGSGATAEQVARVYGLNLSFLDRLGGCHDATEMFTESPGKWLPTMFGN